MNQTGGDVVAKLQAAAQDVEAARAAFEDAQRASSVARSAECAALNKLNQAQKRFDALADTFKTRMPVDSEWRQEERRRRTVVVSGT